MTPFRIIIREAQPHERQRIEAQTGEHLASDHCVAVWLGPDLVGWGDDYGTFHRIPVPGQRNLHDGVVEAQGELLLSTATDFWIAVTR